MGDKGVDKVTTSIREWLIRNQEVLDREVRLDSLQGPGRFKEQVEKLRKLAGIEEEGDGREDSGRVE